MDWGFSLFLPVCSMLFDNHNRPIQYLRLAVTDRCNLRCQYCMPAEGIKYLPKQALMSFEEIVRLVSVLAGLGISKVRITGGEPFLRKDLMVLLRSIRSIKGIRDLHLTTNGLLAVDHLDELVALGIKSINLSLDTLDPVRFEQITRRPDFEKTWAAYQGFLRSGIPVKINCVVMDGLNTEDILPMVELTRDSETSVRFIEEMPFNGSGKRSEKLLWNHQRILDQIGQHYGELYSIEGQPSDTSKNYRISGYKGTFGIIAAYSRTFCGTCNRIRVTAQGMLKTCLYDNGVLDVRDLLRSGCSDDELRISLMNAFQSRPKDGFEAEASRPVHASMSTIGG